MPAPYELWFSEGKGDNDRDISTFNLPGKCNKTMKMGECVMQYADGISLQNWRNYSCDMSSRCPSSLTCKPDDGSAVTRITQSPEKNVKRSWSDLAVKYKKKLNIAQETTCAKDLIVKQQKLSYCDVPSQYKDNGSAKNYIIEQVQLGSSYLKDVLDSDVPYSFQEWECFKYAIGHSNTPTKAGDRSTCASTCLGQGQTTNACQPPS